MPNTLVEYLSMYNKRITKAFAQGLTQMWIGKPPPGPIYGPFTVHGVGGIIGQYRYYLKLV